MYMPAVSKAQARLFKLVHLHQQGKLSRPNKRIKSLAKSMSPEDVLHYAKTKLKGLPEHISDNLKVALYQGFMKRAADVIPNTSGYTVKEPGPIKPIGRMGGQINSIGGIKPKIVPKPMSQFENRFKGIKDIIDSNRFLNTSLESNTFNYNGVNFDEPTMKKNLYDRASTVPKIYNKSPTFTGFNGQPNSVNILAHGGNKRDNVQGTERTYNGLYGFSPDSSAIKTMAGLDPKRWYEPTDMSVQDLANNIGESTNDVHSINSIACNRNLQFGATPELYQKSFPNVREINMVPRGNYGLFSQHMTKDLSPEGYQKGIDTAIQNEIKDITVDANNRVNKFINNNTLVSAITPTPLTVVSDTFKWLNQPSKETPNFAHIPTKQRMMNEFYYRKILDNVAKSIPMPPARPLTEQFLNLINDLKRSYNDAEDALHSAPMHNYKLQGTNWIDNGPTDLRPFAIK